MKTRFKASTFFASMGEAAGELVFPSSIYCIACGNLIDSSRKYSLCDECVRKFNWVTGRKCAICGRPLRNDQQDGKCGVCRDVKQVFTKGYVCVEYDDDTKEIVHHYKFNDQPYIARFVAQIMYDKLKLEGFWGSWGVAGNGSGDSDSDEDSAGISRVAGCNLITAVPMHKKRQRERGYNQAELLAKELSKLSREHFGFDPFCRALERTRQTKAMSSLGVAERRLNLEDAFGVAKGVSVEGKRVLLIDDVLTTGSTASECAKVLFEGGADDVKLAVFAAGTSLDAGGA